MSHETLKNQIKEINNLGDIRVYNYNVISLKNSYKHRKLTLRFMSCDKKTKSNVICG